MKKLVLVALMLIIAPGVYLLTQNGITEPINFFGFLLLVMWVILYAIFYTAFPGNRTSAWTTQLQLVNLWLLCLLIISVTGWFSSPFLFLVYLLVISSYFVLSPLVPLGLIASIVGVYFLQTKEFTFGGDYTLFISLVLTWPVAYYLRSEYLKIAQAENGILVIEGESSSKGGVLPKVLANRITHFASLVRQPLVNIKNYTHVAGSHRLDDQARMDYLQKIFDSAALALRELTKFEEETTGQKMRPAPPTGKI